MNAPLPALPELPQSPRTIQLPKHYKFPKTIGPQAVNRFMPWFETFWHQHKRYPQVSEVMQKFGFTTEQIAQLNSNKFWLTCLERRGIARPTLTSPNGEPIELTAKQVATIAVLTNFADLRPPVVRLSQLGVTEEELNGWYSNPVFTRVLGERADEQFKNFTPDATIELGRLIKRGDFRAIKFYFEITGRAQTKESLDVRQAMQILIEAVQKHVKDPEVLQAIASEVQQLRGLHGLSS